jgi:hypothetical protein
LWVIFALLDPDPDPYSNYGSGSGSNGPIEYGSNTDLDPDPKPCSKLQKANDICTACFVFKISRHGSDGVSRVLWHGSTGCETQEEVPVLEKGRN